MAWDKRDGHMIRYLVNHGFYKAGFIPTGKHCGEKNSRTHVTNSCPAFDKLRADTWKELDKLIKSRINMETVNNGNLEKVFLDAYFKPGSKFEERLEILKNFSLRLAITNTKTDTK